jgi:hypothetical protein
MADYKIGYGKPPKWTQFQPGTSGNLKGRPKLVRSEFGDVVSHVLDGTVRYRENGRSKTATRHEVTLKSLLFKAIKGDVGAAEILVETRAQAATQADSGSNQLLILDWLPDYEAEQKTRTPEPGSGLPIAPAEVPVERSDASAAQVTSSKPLP